MEQQYCSKRRKRLRFIIGIRSHSVSWALVVLLLSISAISGVSSSRSSSPSGCSKILFFLSFFLFLISVPLPGSILWYSPSIHPLVLGDLISILSHDVQYNILFLVWLILCVPVLHLLQLQIFGVHWPVKLAEIFRWVH